MSQLAGLARHGTRATGTVRFDWGPVIVVGVLAAVALAVAGWFGSAAPASRSAKKLESQPNSSSRSSARSPTCAPSPTRAARSSPRTRTWSGRSPRPACRARRPRRRLEYLERVLVDLDATAASARRLTDLFRIAKFSDHPVDAQAKEDAIAALEAVRDELRDAQ